MYAADLSHPNVTLQEKLKALYQLNRARPMELGFREAYLRLLEAFGNPHLSLPPVIHVAGTNGKGSTVAMLCAVLESGGYKAHMYTSPHMVRFNERIILAGEEIDDKSLESLIDEALDLNAGGDVTFFEITTAIMFAAFSRCPADVALVEVGLGGRLDCTNVIPNPLCTAITRISMDHMAQLGNTLELIAAEKAGIMKADVPCVISSDNKAVYPVFRKKAEQINSPLVKAEGFKAPVMPNLPGTHQSINAQTVMAVLDSVSGHFPVAPDIIAHALQNVTWKGRLETLADYEGTRFIFDCGHNDSAGQVIGRWLAFTHDAPVHVIAGMKGDKDPKAFLGPIMGEIDTLGVVPLHGVGPCITIHDLPGDYGATEFKTLKDAIDSVRRYHSGNKIILICGSVYLYEDAQNYCKMMS